LCTPTAAKFVLFLVSGAIPHVAQFPASAAHDILKGGTLDGDRSNDVSSHKKFEAEQNRSPDAFPER